MAGAEPSWNYLGVEIREPLVEEANRLGKEAGHENLHYEFCNAMLWLDRLLEEIPPGILQAVTIQFPDPWFKKKHAKRRMVNQEMIDTIDRHLAPEGRVFIQTDIQFLAEEMFARFREDGRFEELPLEANPFTVKTEREKAVEDKDLPVHRTLFLKKN